MRSLALLALIVSTQNASAAPTLRPRAKNSLATVRARFAPPTQRAVPTAAEVDSLGVEVYSANTPDVALSRRVAALASRFGTARKTREFPSGEEKTRQVVRVEYDGGALRFEATLDVFADGRTETSMSVFKRMTGGSYDVVAFSHPDGRTNLRRGLAATFLADAEVRLAKESSLPDGAALFLKNVVGRLRR